ncbi:MAG: hypothetical protein S4CHLAM123_11200 [Chlamydiales bacterium]|nr:hypothetical protein [Chlamydiales bacterium]
MRINVKKYLVVGPQSARDSFFKRIQELGIVEFLRKEPASLETPQEIQTFIDALHVLRQMPSVTQTPKEDYKSANVLARHVVDRNHELERLREQVRLIDLEINRIQIFGDFSLPILREIEQETGRVVQFFFCKKSETLQAPQRAEVIPVGHAYGLDYFVSINKERTTYDGFIEIVIERSLSELHAELAQCSLKIDEYETELATLAHQQGLVQKGLYSMLNHYNLEDSKARVQSIVNGQAFAVEGWVPKNKIKDLQKVASELAIYVEPIGVEEKDRVPTYLENTGLARLGEDLINIYDTPSKTDRDPSLWVFIAFGVFFSMIIADLGYGLILFGISLWLYFKFGRKKGGLIKRFSLLTMSLSIGCIIWGILLPSFLGIEFSPNSKFRSLSVIDWMVRQKAEYFIDKKPTSYKDLIHDYPELKNATTADQLLTTVVRKQEGMDKYVVYNNFQDNVLIELAIFIGTVHLILSFLRYLDRSWSGIGWIVFMVGSYLFFPLVLGAVSLIHYIFHVPYELGGFIGKYVLFSGLGIVMILGVVQKKLAGIGEVLHVISVFADVMSYLRIYALSLAGMIMATTFDQIGTSMPIYFGIFIILAGHLVNLTLALMGGVIHGLRLNFIEWYHYSFEGGGKHFNPLSLLKID